MAKETFKQAFKAARDSGVRYFYWKGKKYTTRHKEEDKDEKVYDKKKKYPKRHSTWGKKKDAKELDYVPQTQRKGGGTIDRYKSGGIIQHD
jgi:broad specificity polyphosphatase/5'/3'-nucleotidase SurE|tara:strand:+ start:416 stop:688 length:273 start_codon:yes stop_codon:yes gene_type:complete